MHANDVIETYIDDTVRQLPRRQRDDVATELRSLLNEELHARAEASGHSPDASVALSLVRDYGHPNEVAARYQPRHAIIDPADSTSFIRAAIIGACALALLSVINKRVPGAADDSLNIGILVWLGLLVVAFGAKSWIRRYRPGTALWKPRDRNRVNRVGTAIVVPVAAFFIALYAAPTWMLHKILGHGFDASGVAYTANFQRHGLPWLIGLMIGLVALLSLAAIQGRWRRLTRRIDLGINMALACLILGMAVDGNIFQSSQADQIARGILALVAVVYVAFVGFRLYGEIGRVERVGLGSPPSGT